MTVSLRKIAIGAVAVLALGVAATAHAQSPEQRAEAMRSYNAFMGGGAPGQGTANADVMQRAMGIAQLLQKYLIQTVSTNDANQQAQIRTNAAAEVAGYYQKMGIPADQAKGLADNMVVNVLENPQVLAKARANMGK